MDSVYGRGSLKFAANMILDDLQKFIEMPYQVFAIVAGLVGVVIWLMRISSYLGVLELKINTLWDFQLRCGAAEALEKGIATMNSPIP